MSPAPHADFSRLRYAQCWEDADTLLDALGIHPGDHCLSIASAGDNTLALLAADPASVTAVDLSPAQLACLRLRMAAYRRLSHPELLQLLGSRPSTDRTALYHRCRTDLPDPDRTFWDARESDLRRHGLGGAGKFERYFRLFRRFVLPCIHSRRTVRELLRPRDPEARAAFYDHTWDTLRWRLLFRMFFSRAVMGRLGRDPAFFRHVEGSVADRILARTRHALRKLDPSDNPYLHWILTGTHGKALPFALREEHFETLRERLDRVRLLQGPVEAGLDGPLDRANLSDLFEYLAEDDTRLLLERLAGRLRPGGRLVYWNLLAPRSSGGAIPGLRLRRELGDRLLSCDKAWFYSKLIVEEKGSTMDEEAPRERAESTFPSRVTTSTPASS